MDESARPQTRAPWSRGTKRWVTLVAFCLVVVAIGIFIFANPPSSKQPPAPNSGTTGEITVPGTPASGMSVNGGSVVVALSDVTSGHFAAFVRLT